MEIISEEDKEGARLERELKLGQIDWDRAHSEKSPAELWARETITKICYAPAVALRGLKSFIETRKANIKTRRIFR